MRNVLRCVGVGLFAELCSDDWKGWLRPDEMSELALLVRLVEMLISESSGVFGEETGSVRHTWRVGIEGVVIDLAHSQISTLIHGTGSQRPLTR
jgi:hypothetical protein